MDKRVSKTKQPKATAANISRVLSDAGHYKSESHTTAIRGWHNITAGFRVRSGEPVTVEYRADRYDRDDKARRDAKIEAYRATLAELFAVKVVRGEYVTTLQVTAKDPVAS